MRIKSNLFFKSFILSLIGFALVGAVIVASLYMDKTALVPLSRETNVLIGITRDGEAISFTVINFNPSKQTVKLLHIPDNLLLDNGSILQHNYETEGIRSVLEKTEELIGARIDRHMIFSTEAISALTDTAGKFEYLIPYKFVYNGMEYSGNQPINGKLAGAMFNYSGYDMTKVSMSEMAGSFLASFLSKHGNASSIAKILSALTDGSLQKKIVTDLEDDELTDYCTLISSYLTLNKETVQLNGQYRNTTENIYFYPNELISDHNIFHK